MTGAAARRPRAHGVAWWLVALALVLRLGAGLVLGRFELPRTQWERGYESGAVARSLVAGRGFSDPYLVETGPTANVGPVLPFVHAGLMLVWGVDSPVAWWSLLALHVLASSATVLAARRLGDRVGGPVVGVLAAAAWAVHPVPVLAATGWPHSVHVFGLVLVLTVDRVVAWEEGCASGSLPDRRAVLGLGALVGLGAWCEPLLLPFMAAWGVSLLLRRRWAEVRAALLAATLALALVSPWLARNAVAMGGPTLLRSRLGPELWLGALAGPGEPTPIHRDPTRDRVELDRLRAVGEARWAAEKRAAALALIRERPARWLAACAWRWGVFWLGRLAWWQPADGHPLLGGALTASRGLTHLLPVLVAFAGLYRLRRQRSVALSVLALLFLVYPLTYALTHVEARYRLPIEPVVLVVAACGLAPWLRRRGLADMLTGPRTGGTTRGDGRREGRAGA